MVQKVEFNQKNANPFYGMTHTLSIFQQGSKGIVSESQLEKAWNECVDSQQKAALVSVLFSIGDITARQHNIFGAKVDSGGNSHREAFRDVIIPFLVSKFKNDIQGLIKLIVEYTTMDNVLAARVRTKKKSTTVIGVINMIAVFGIDELSTYCANVIRGGTDFQKLCVAKFLTRPRFSKRPGHNKMLPETREVMEARTSLIKAISDKVGFPYHEKDNYINFEGYIEWRKPYIGELESVLFSTGAVNEMDDEQFLQFLDNCPSDARFRVRNRVMFDESGKWKRFKELYTKWESFKDAAQKEQRELEAKIHSGEVDKAEVADKLKAIKKSAKVTTGAINFGKMFSQIVLGTIDKVKVQPFLDKINLPYNTLVFMDDSGSMNWGSHNGYKPCDFAAFMATICMMKNPDDEASNLMGMFSGTTRMYNNIQYIDNRPNALMRGQTRRVAPEPLIDKKDHFLDNLKRMRQACAAACVNGATYVSSIPDGINAWVNGDSQRLEELMRYPVWTLISDGNFNNKSSVTSSMLEFFKKCDKYFGFRPFVVLIDVAHQSSADIQMFDGVDNVMMVPPNPAAIEMFLTRFRDLDVYDVYTPIQSMYRSNRYAPVKHFVFQYDDASIPDEVKQQMEVEL